MLRQDLQTALFILSPLEVLRPFPGPSSPTILRTTKGDPVTFCGQFFALSSRGGVSPFTEGDGVVRHFLGPVFRTYILSALGLVFQIFYPQKVPFLSIYPLSRYQFIKMRYRVCSWVSKMRFCVRSIVSPPSIRHLLSCGTIGSLFNCCTTLR